MATYEELMAALRKADAAGDVEAAKAIARKAAAAKGLSLSTPQATRPPADAATPNIPQDAPVPSGFTDQIAALMSPPVQQTATGPRVAAPSTLSKPPQWIEQAMSSPAPAAPMSPESPAPAPAAPMDMIATAMGLQPARPAAPPAPQWISDAIANPPPANQTPLGEALLTELGNAPERVLRGFKGNTLADSERGMVENLKTAGRAKSADADLQDLRSQIAADQAALLQAAPESRATLTAELNAKIERERALSGAVAAGRPADVLDRSRTDLERNQRARAQTQAEIDALDAAIKPTNPAPGLDQAIVSGISSLADMAPGLATTLVTRNPIPMLAYLGAYSRGGAYADKRAEGVASDKALTAANLYAVAETIPEILPLHVILKEGIGAGSRIAGGAATEAASEALTQALQQLVDIGVLDRNMTWAQAVAEMQQAAAAGGVMGGFMGGLGAAADAGRNAVRKRQEAKGTPADPNAPQLNAATPGPSQGQPKPAPMDQIAATMQPPAQDAAPTIPRPAQPAQQAQQTQQPADPMAQITAAMTGQRGQQNGQDGQNGQNGQTITRADVDANPDQFEIIDVSEGQGKDWRATGEQVVLDKRTGRIVPLAPDAASQANVQSVPDQAQGAPANPATAADVIAASGEQAPPTPAGVPNQPRNFEFIDAAGVQKIGTQPDVMQYKAGGDQDGVTDRLRGITDWRPERAGMAIIYEYADGRRVIADGHQRLGLAKRLAGQGKPIQMPAMILREADGVTPQQARVTAALKNIAEGSGTALDAAKVLRGSSETVEQMGLPPNSAIVRDAQGMRDLSDVAFGMVVNGVASERDGGIVGRVVTDKQAQANILSLLSRLQKDRPMTAFQAESVARQAAADTVTQTQDSLFGPEADTQNLYLERAKILEAASRMTRDEARAFKNVLDNADRLQAAGNQLDADGNQTRLDSAAAMRDYLTREANTKGAISEALTAAARALNGGATLAGATRQFLDAVEQRLAAGGLVSGQPETSGSGRPSGDQGGQAVGGERPQEPGDQGLNPDQRDENAADGDLFGAAPAPAPDPQADILAAMQGQAARPEAQAQPEAQPGAAPATSNWLDTGSTGKTPEQIRAEAEAKVRADQSKMRKPGGNDGDAGPLFDAQGDLLGATDALADDLRKRQDKIKEMKAERRSILDRYTLEGDDEANSAAGYIDLADTPVGERLLSDLADAKTFQEKRKVADAFVLEQGRASGVEHLVVLTEDGIPLAITSGHKAGVSFPAAVWRAGTREEIAYSVHNHPSSNGFSGSDLAILAIWPKHTLAIIGHNGDRHEVKATRLFDMVNDVALRNPQAAFQPLKEAIEEAREAANWTINKFLLDRGEANDAGFARYHVATRPFFQLVLEDLGQIRYTDRGKWLATFRAQNFNYEDFYGQVSGAVADRLGRAGFIFPESGGSSGNRPSDGGSQAAPSRTDGTDQKPAIASGKPDGGRLQKEPVSTGNADLDGALDDLFGDKSDVSGTGTDLERPGRNGNAADGVGAGNVPASARPSDGRTGSRGKAADGANGERGADSGLPDSNAPSVGTGGDPGADGTGGADSKPAASGKRGRRNGGGNGRLSSDRSGKGDIAGNASGATGKLTPEERLAAIRGILKEDVLDFVAGDGANMLREDPANPIDPQKADALKSIFVDALDGADVAQATDRDLFRAIIMPLKDAGMTREEVAQLSPYLTAFLGDLRAGRVNMAPEAAPMALDRLNAAVPGWTAMNGVLTNPDPERGGIIDQAILGKKWFVVLNGSTRSVDGLDTVDQAVDWFIQNHAAPAKPKPTSRIIPADRANIDATLPLLLPVQRDDVFKVEQRFAKPDGHGMLITNGTGTGKAQPLDAGILTPLGWRKMGDLAVGDLVISADGTPTEVVGVYPQGEKPIYRVEFSDGAVTECCDEHLWETQTLYARRKSRENPEWGCAQPQVRSMAEIRATLDEQHFVPVAAPIEHPAKVLPVRPYTLGVILGDGCLRGGAITISGQDQQIAKEVAADVGDGFCLARVRESRCPTWRISDFEQKSRAVGGQFSRHRMVSALRDMGLMGADSATKFIPADYLTSSITDRLHLLQGLMDTDGTVDRRTGSVSFCTVSQHLADGVIALVRSLGGIATRTTARKFFTHKGKRREGQIAHIITMHLPNGIAPFRLSRKIALVRDKAHGPRRKIVSVSLIGSKPAQCIAVAHPRHLYVTDDYVLTHNTYSGGGVIKRFHQQGKSNILIVAPSDAVIDGWVRTMDALGVPVQRLADTTDAGQGVVITTYANMRANAALATREWDLVVADEAQNLMQNAQGDPTNELGTLRAITHRPKDLWLKSKMLHSKDWADYKAMPQGDAKNARFRSLKEREEREIAAWAGKPRSKVLFLSATPFAYDKTVDYAEGYLFEYPQDGRVGNSNQTGRNIFFVKNFGYRIRYHKLTRPEHAVDSAVFEREFHENLKRQGVLSGRSLQVDVDYDRKFVKKEDADGTRLDEALEALDNLARAEREADYAEVKAGRVGRKPQPYSALQAHMAKNFDYLARQQLLEAIKAKLAVDEIKAHLALGRKVVVFHDFNVGGGLNPFTHLKTKKVGVDEATGEDIREPVSPMTGEAMDGYRMLLAAHPWIRDLNFAGYKPPIKALPEALGKTVRLFNGTVPTKQRLENLAAFNTDGSGVDVLVVQADAGGAGISMHDVTGKQQRALINLGMPTKPTTTLQQEGRIRRVGSKTDAIFRYFTIGTTWERTAFAQRIAERSGTVENLALGNEARDLLNAFIDAYMDASDFAPSAEDGKGGAAKDMRGHNITPFQRAVSHYFGRPKITGRRDQRDGIDFYPTPEPLAYKMVEWAGLRANEKVLEPSAGDGAIVRYMPDDVALTFVEPSGDLRATAQLRAPKGDARETTFENHHISNKYHAIVMNPPFGQGGATAIAHLAKAAKHLRAGGRIVALIPTGPSADKRFAAWWESDDAKGLNLSAEVQLPSVAFERAGTGVMTRVVIIDKPAEGQEIPLGQQNLNFTGAQNIKDFFDRLEGYDVRRRPDPVRDVVEELEAEGQDAGTPADSRRLGPPLATEIGSFEKTTVTSKKGKVFPAAHHAAKVERDVYDQMKAAATALDGWWHRNDGTSKGSGPTFAFRTEAARDAFLADMQKPTIAGMEETAYHGTPHDFDRFSLDAIGTGEGAQVFGWGLYFAGKRAVSEWYRDKLSRVDPALVQSRLQDRLENMAKEWGVSVDDLPDIIDVSEERAAVMRELEAEHAESSPGRLFTVDIPGPETLLDWDARLADQPEAVRDALKKIPSDVLDAINEKIEGRGQSGFDSLDEMTGRELIKWLTDYDVQESLPISVPGSSWLDGSTSYEQHASMYLRSIGIPGHRYLDGSSRNAGEGSHNYVIYDDAAIQIIAKEQRAQMVREAAATTEEIRRLMPNLRAELDRLDLKRVRLSSREDAANWQGAFVVTGDGEMEIVIGASLDPMKTLHHEVIHALRAMNLFTPQEWKALTLAAGSKWLDKHDIAARYPHLTEAERIEEAIAEEFSQALAAKQAPKGSILIQAFNKIARIFRAFRNVLNGAGYQTPEEIFGRVLSGEISARQAGNTGARVGMQAQARSTRLENWSKQVFALFRNERLPEMMDLGEVPAVLRRLGAIGQRLVMATGKAKTVTKTHRDLTPNSWLKLPNLIRDPEIVIDHGDGQRAGDLLVVTSERADNGSHVVVAINRTGRDENNQPATVVVTMFPKDRLESTLAKAERDGKILYVRARREGDGYEHIGTNPRSASPVGDTISRLRADRNILTYPDVFKAGDGGGFNESRTLYQRPLAVRPLTPQGRAHRNSALGATPFIPDRRIWETLTRAGIPIWQRLRDLPGAASDAVDRARYTIQDRMLPFLRAQEAVMRQTGRPLPKEHDVYLSETTFSGKVGRHLLDIDERFTKPIIQIIAASNGRMDADSVGQWLYARHAQERNAYIASINPMMQDGGSGMTNAEAAQILADVAASPDAASYDRIGDLIDKMRAWGLDLRENAGLIGANEALLWRSQYKHYVPLKGYEETDHAESVMDLRGVRTGRRFSIRGAESRRALGRRSEAFNPLQSAITQAQEVAIRAEKNRVAQAMYELAKTNPSKALWEVKKPKQKRYFNRTTGLVETRVEDPVSMVMEPNEMAVKIDGQEHRILFNDQRLAEAAGTLGADQMSGVLRVLSIFSRFFSMTRTMLNPEFMLTNAFRDFQTAQFNIQAFGENDKARIAKAMAKNWRKAFMGAMRGGTYRFDTEWSRYFNEFQKAGAQVWFWTMEQPEVARDDLGRRIELARGNRAQRALKLMTTPSAFFNFRDNPALAYIERINLAVDNAIRLAAFVEARKAGWTVEDAAFLAKELTVNFNRRGEAGAQMNALYPFFNAAIQGTVRTVKAIGSRRVAMMVATAVGAGVLLDLANAALSEEDDDGELFYDKVPNWRNERNLHFVLWGTGDNPFAIPMPYGYNVFPYAGQQIGKVIRGVKDADDAFADLVTAVFGAYSPISAATPAQMISPVLSDPIVELGENKNWLGIPIYPQTYGNQTEPDAYVHFRGATEVSKWVAQTLNGLTGGDFREPGAIDVSPETLDHLSSFVVGSAGAFWGKTADIFAKSMRGDFDSIERRNVPFLRNITSPVGEWVDRDRYYRFGAEVKNAQADRKAYEAAGKPIPEETRALSSLYEAWLSAERERNLKGEWNPSRTSALAAREESKVFLDFNRKYLSVMGRQGE